MPPIQYKFEVGKELPAYRLPPEAKYEPGSNENHNTCTMINAAFDGLLDWCTGAINIKKKEYKQAADAKVRDVGMDQLAVTMALQQFAQNVFLLKRGLDELKAKTISQTGKPLSAGEGEEEPPNVPEDLIAKISEFLISEVYEDGEEEK